MVRIAILSGLLGMTACGGETRYDVYMRGLQVQAEAERGPCQLEFDGGARAQVLSGDDVQTCLQQLEQAIGLYEKAMRMGADEDVEVRQAHEKALEHKRRLEGMLRQVRKMERDAVKRRAASGS